MPVFEGLLPNQAHNLIVRKLLFELSTWHGLAKLRLHTETTVCDLEHSTTRLGDLLRKFQNDMCSAYQTFDLPAEEAARVRRKAAATKKAGETTVQKTKSKESSVSRKVRKFNLNTYKIHSLGGYAKAIRLFGTADGYNTQTVRIELSFGSCKVCKVDIGNRENSSIDVPNGFSRSYGKGSISLELANKFDGNV